MNADNENDNDKRPHDERDADGQACPGTSRFHTTGDSSQPADERRYHPWVNYEAVAYHEAAHAVADTATGVGLVQSLELAPQIGVHGWASIGHLHPDLEPVLAGDESGPAYFFARLTGVLAGPVAESILGRGMSGDAPTSYEGWEKSQRENQWDEEDEPDPTSDYADALRLSGLCGVPPAEGWAQADRLLREPAVWGAVESVAQGLLSLKDRGLPPVLGGDELQEILGGVDWPEAYRPTTLDEAMAIVRARSPQAGRAWWAW